MQPFIDIHTHNSVENANVWQLCSLFPEQDAITNPFSVGIHPWYIADDWQEQMQQVAAKACLESCVAIGECGLDKIVEVPLLVQKKVFEAHIQLANKLQKPLIVHCVKAYDELLSMVKKVEVPMILHDFSKNANLAQQLQQKDICLSVGKALFRPYFSNILPKLEVQKLFFETDDMDCEVSTVYGKAAEILSVGSGFLQQQIHRNFKRVFK